MGGLPMRRRVGATVAGSFLLFALVASVALAGHGGKQPPGKQPLGRRPPGQAGAAAKGNFARVLFVDFAKGSAGRAQATAAATDFHVSNHPLGQSLTYAISTTGCTPDCGGGAGSVAAGFS